MKLLLDESTENEGGGTPPAESAATTAIKGIDKLKIIKLEKKNATLEKENGVLKELLSGFQNQPGTPPANTPQAKKAWLEKVDEFFFG